ncbi:hypothetical protein MMC10_001031 [Thelotrema lepadinum]|nr:hypothetical protein [Thelotrema lepadinum]
MSTTALLVIDVQQGFDHPTHWGSTWSNPAFQANFEKLLKAFRAATGKPLIINVQHDSLTKESPLHPSSKGNAFHPWSKPMGNELVVKKNVNSAFIGTNLESILRQYGIKKLYVCGLTTDQCVSTTLRMASNMHVCDWGEEKGDVILVEDATSAYDYGELSAETIHKVHVATLGHEFCRVVKTREAMEEIRDDAEK